ncbi:MAG: hypothetical protein HYU53_15205 [Acidobacteria bacterium]|nr:hypothetical protein [Acidobacteriota bacterium]
MSPSERILYNERATHFELRIFIRREHVTEGKLLLDLERPSLVVSS